MAKIKTVTVKASDLSAGDFFATEEGRNLFGWELVFQTYPAKGKGKVWVEMSDGYKRTVDAEATFKVERN